MRRARDSCSHRLCSRR
uniref:Uncharacterized protein n=1 Tax=Zea mays TaxID=4577 RepID=C4J4K4_MAIZE|nr:unknown [Zea mays]